jgi:D-3-phosphoglycerate dehydrogenase
VEHPNTPITRKVIDSLDSCQLIAKYSIGLDNIDLEAASERGIIVCHAPGYCVEEVSDHAVALLLCLARHIVFFDRHVQNGGWHDLILDPPMRRLTTQVVGFLGFGRIARRVASKMKPFGVRMLCFDPYITAELSIEHGVETVDLETLLRTVDYLSIHAPLTPETQHIIGPAQFGLMKSTAWLINTSRGRLIDEAALTAALSSGTIAGAALDVTEIEPLPSASALRGMRNVVLTSHHAALSIESLQELRTTIAASMEAFCRGYWPDFVANSSVKPRRPLKPWGEFAVLPNRSVKQEHYAGILEIRWVG